MYNRQILTYTTIAIISFIILGSVQFFLLYNTYKLKNEHYSVNCLPCIADVYGKSIKNDKVFPGGEAIIDHYIYAHMDSLEKTVTRDPGVFKRLGQLITDSIVRELQRKNNMDSVLAPLNKSSKSADTLEYSLNIVSLDIAFKSNQYTPLYNWNEDNPYLNKKTQTPWGAHIGGSLQSPGPQNLITSLTVSSESDHSYRLTFNLFVDSNNRKAAILKLMLPTFLLCLVAIFSVVSLFFVTFRNWIRQKKLSEMKSDFINSITHEFHTPLATIIIANKTLQSEKFMASREHIQPFTNVIERQSNRLKMLISRVLDITTMNKIVPDKKTISVHHILEDILEDYRLKQANSSLNLAFRKNAQSDMVLADLFWFTTLIINILDNAVKYNDKKYKEIEVTTSNVRKSIVVDVRDNGEGMDAETRKHVFEKFYRSPEQVKRESTGLGLGLYYVKMCVQAHHWKIDLDSDIGSGSIFHITIPLCPETNT